MALIKPIFCSSICILYFTALTAQLPLQKYKTISNVINHHFYQQKHWSIKQVLKDSVLFKYESYFHHSVEGPTISHLSMIYISFIEESPVPQISVSEQLESYLQKKLLLSLPPNKYLFITTSCWDPDFLRRYEVPISYSFESFFKYQ